MKEFFKYKLVNPISVSVSGTQENIYELTVKGPRPADRIYAMKLESVLGKVLLSFFKENNNLGEPDNSSASLEKNKKSKKSDNEEYQLWEMILIGNIEEDKIGTVVNCLRELVCAGNTESPQGLIGETKMTAPLFDQISYKDLKTLIARYSVDFLFSDLN
jgi:hypothetical protein